MPPGVESGNYPIRTRWWGCFQPCGDKATVTSVTWVTVGSGLEPDCDTVLWQPPPAQIIHLLGTERLLSLTVPPYRRPQAQMARPAYFRVTLCLS